MNKTQFTSFMRAPLSLPAESGKLLEEVIREFPYCQTAQLLFLKSLHNQNSIHYNRQLKIAAAFASDRRVLHHLITSKTVDPVKVKEETPKTFEKPVTRNDEQIVEELNIPKQVTPVITEKKEEAKPKLSPQEILQARLDEINKASAKKEPVKTEVPLEKPAEIPEEDLHTNQEKTPEESISISSEEEKKVVLEHSNPDIRQKKTIPVPEPENITEPVDTDDTLRIGEDLVILSDSYISTAIDATIQIELDKPEELMQPLPADEAEARNEEETADQEMSFYSWLKKGLKTPATAEQNAENEQKTEEEKLRQQELIEKFIKEEPKISKPKKEFYNPVNMARQSVIEDPEFVTETLAGIYAKQGNIAKAIQAYQTLSLKYPEKRLYFASLIEKLESGE